MKFTITLVLMLAGCAFGQNTGTLRVGTCNDVKHFPAGDGCNTCTDACGMVTCTLAWCEPTEPKAAERPIDYSAALTAAVAEIHDLSKQVIDLKEEVEQLKLELKDRATQIQDIAEA